MWFMFVFPFIIFLVTFLSIVLNIFRVHKHANKAVKDVIETTKQYSYQVENEAKPAQPQTKICAYCGATIAPNASKCNACGARVSK